MSIQIKNLSKKYSLEDEELIALDDISLTIEKGDFVLILGQSGCGKSTLLNILGGMDKLTSGEISVNNKNLGKLKQDQLAKYRRETVGMIFQKFNLISDMSLLENVMLPLKFSGMPDAKQKKIAKEALENVGLEKRIKSRPSKLSGGQQQRVAIARALVNNPEILLCDEPTGNLDSKTGQEILSIISDLNSKGHTVVMVTHNEKYARYSNKVVKMLDGQIVSIVQNDRKTRVADFEAAKTKNINHLSRLKLALNNLRRRKLRFFLTSFGVSIGAMAIVTLVSFGAGLQKDVEKQVSSYSQIEEVRVSGEKITDIGFSAAANFNKSEKKNLNDKTVEELSKIDNASKVYPLINFSGSMKYGDRTSVMYGENAGPLDLIKDEVKSKVTLGQYLKSDDQNSVVIPFGQAKVLFDNVSEAIGKDVICVIEGLEFKTKIAGVIGEDEKFSYSTTFSDGSAQNIIKSIKTEEMKKADPDLYSNIMIRAKDASSVSVVKKAVDDKGYGSSSYEDVAKETSRTFIIMQVVLGIVGGIALLVASLGIANTMLMAVLERTKEIGVMRAVGARSRDISSIFISEAFLIGLFGGLVGLILGYGGSNVAEAVMNGYIMKGNGGSDSISFYIPLYLSLGVVLFSVMVSSLAGYLPAKRASKLDPVNALRDE